MAALPTMLTLSDITASLVRRGLIKTVFATATTTATHTLLTVTLSQPVLFPPTAGCTPLKTLTSTFTCDLGNVGANTTVLRLIQFQSPDVSTCLATPCTLTATATVTFAEGGTDNLGGPQGTKNDSLTATRSIQLFAAGDNGRADGGCAITFPASLGTQASLTVNQASQVSFFQASDLTGVPFPCTPGATGVKTLQSIPPTLHLNGIWFVDLQTSPQLATAVLTVFNLPSGVNANSFVLLELVDYDITRLFVVPACVNGDIPRGGPAAFPDVTFDSCVFSQGGFGRGGVSVTVKIRPFGDPGFAG
jgi:hypothetical protein